MDELARTMHTRAVEAASDDGRLGAPVFVEWDVWPFEGTATVKPLAQPVVPERTRSGEDGSPCELCDRADDAFWSNGRWELHAPDEPSGMPLVAWLAPRDHLDLGDLDDDMAAEMGRLLVAITAVLEGRPEIGRVQLNRWGDGSAHLHVLVMARPYGLPQIRGSFVTIWDDILPPFPVAERDAWLATLAAGLDERLQG